MKSICQLIALATLLAPLPVAAQRGRPAPAPSPFAAALAAATPDVQAAVNTFLSDSLLGGRIPGTPGGTLAALFIAAQFQALGLTPGAGGTYLQPVPLLRVHSRASVVFGAGRETFTPKSPDEAVLWPVTTDSLVTMDGEMVFAGYGIEAPEFGWDDYKGVPQSGRIVLVLAGDPGTQDTAAYGGRKRPRYANFDYKLAQAARMGAAGLLVVHDGPGASWARLVAPLGRDQLWLDAPRTRSPLKFAGWVRGDLARRLLTTAGRDYQLLLRRARQREFSPVATGVYASIDIDADVSPARAFNVIGRVEGSDSAARRDPIVLAAPYVRLGSDNLIWTDSTAPASGGAASVATLLTAAAGAARFSPAPRRPIVFVATAARPGMEHLAQSQPRAAVVYFEGAASEPPVDATGLDRSALGEIALAAASAEDLVLGPTDSDAAFVASGAYPIAVATSPVISLRPTPSPKTARLALRVAWAVATSTQTPSWYPGMGPTAPR